MIHTKAKGRTIYIADDADANLDDNAGKLTFLARTCVQYNVKAKSKRRATIFEAIHFMTKITLMTVDSYFSSNSLHRLATLAYLG